MMDNCLEYCILLCNQLDQLLEDDYMNITPSLRGDLYESYKKLVMKEKEVLEESIELLKRCNSNY